jgi:predicted Na+-dependent transporter
MVRTLIPITLFAIMFALGIGLTGEAVSLIRRRPALLIRVVLGSCLLVPLAALLLLHLPISQALSPPVRFAIALMALCPSAPLALRKSARQGGDGELAALLQVLAALVAIVTVPLMGDVFRVSYDVVGWDIDHREVAAQVAKAQVLPLLLGLGLGRWRPDLAARLRGPLERIANALLLALVVLVLVVTAPHLLPFLAGNLLALPFMALMVLLSLAIGWLMDHRDTRERISTSLVTAMRNPGLALLLATTYAGELRGLKLGILLYVLITLLVSAPFLRWSRRLAGAA